MRSSSCPIVINDLRKSTNPRVDRNRWIIKVWDPAIFDSRSEVTVASLFGRKNTPSRMGDIGVCIVRVEISSYHIPRRERFLPRLLFLSSPCRAPPILGFLGRKGNNQADRGDAESTSARWRSGLSFSCSLETEGGRKEEKRFWRLIINFSLQPGF